VRLAGLIIALALTVVAVAWYGLRNSSAAQWQSVSWRIQLFARKATGGVPDLSWSDLREMAGSQGGFGLEAFVTRGVSLEGSVVNRRTTDDDVAIGSRLFAARCSECHGEAGTGRHAPALNEFGYARGDTDLAVYTVVRDGVPAAGMEPPQLSAPERWQVIAYLRQLQADRPKPGVATLDIDVPAKQLVVGGGAEGEWLTYSGTVDGQRYSKLTELTPANVSKLRLLWSRQFNGIGEVESTPLAADGVMFVTLPPSTVVALDIDSGKVLWTYQRNMPRDLSLCCGKVNRGVGILGGAVYLGALDGYLVALNARTGKTLWEVRVAVPREGHTITGAPLVTDRSVVVGTAGGEFGIRGVVEAYDPITGERQWRFDTIPGPGETGHETWKNDAWKTGGGATWITGSYDPSLNLVYWGVGNPAPPFAGDVRPGDNLFTNSVVALHADSGRLAWYFQFTPHDNHDWDSAQTPILADVVIDGRARQVICWPNRNGFYYVLDRVTGEFLTGIPFVEQNWARGLDSRGRPLLTVSGGSSTSGRLTKPGGNGGTNWQNSAFDGRLVFVPATEGETVYTSKPDPRPGARRRYLGSAAVVRTPIHVIRALEPATGAKRWEYFPPYPDDVGNGGLLATRGGLVFGASGGSLFALESTTGVERWTVPLGGGTVSAPISFVRRGQQVLAVFTGQTLFVFGL
jgi:alcohol dehydrogenase (cytochrome c)